MTLKALRTVLQLGATGQEWLRYGDFAVITGFGYEPLAHHISQLAEGRSGKAGLGLLAHRHDGNRGQRFVALTDDGHQICRLFLEGAPQDSDEGAPASPEPVAEALRAGPLAAIELAVGRLPAISLGTFAVFLHVVLLQPAFGYSGTKARVLEDQLQISNLPRHLALLTSGSSGKFGYGLIEMMSDERDARVRAPAVTSAGHDIASHIAAAVSGEAVIRPVRARPQKLRELPSPSEISLLTEEDFEAIHWEQPEDRSEDGQSQ